LPGLDLAGGGAAMLDDDVEAVFGADPGGHLNLGVEGADIGLDRARGHAGGARRAVEAGADPALDAQGRLVDMDRDLGEGERAVDAGNLDAQVEAGAEAQPVERAGDASVRPAAQSEVDGGAGADFGDHAGEQCGDPVRLFIADAGALEQSGDAVAAAQCGAKIDDRPFRAVGERLDRVGRRHPAAGVGAISERSDRKRARRFELGIVIGRRRGALDRLQGRRQRPGRVAERAAGDQAAKPCPRADVPAEIGDEVDAADIAPAAIFLAESGLQRQRAIEAGVERQLPAAARRRAAHLVQLVQGRSVPARLKSRRAGPTNTGKTHLAIERMCGHSSGMIGFPLRLLAREVYDRVVAMKGANQVALITGEEKIKPGARYFLCTAKHAGAGGAMPRDGELRDFLRAIDEAQLGADPERGHVFTDRMLRAAAARRR
jgi:hypothetical protein